MKKITLLILTFLLSFSGFSQVLNEGFEGGTFPPTVPGNWAVFQNGFGSNVWTTNTVIPHTGTKAAQINSRQNIGMGNTSKDFLATPLVTVPTNGQLRFWSRTAVNGNQGTKYQVRIASGALPANQTNEAAYTTLVQEWTEDQLSTTFNIYEEKVVDLTAYAGQQIYIAFVDEYTQASTTLSGDSWLLDDVLLVSRCLDPTTLTANPVTYNSATLGWTNPSGATSWEIEVMLAGPALPTGSGTVVNTNPYTATALTGAPFTPLQPLTSYKYYVRSLCTFSGSLWIGPFTFTTQAAPPICGGNFVDSGGTTANYPNNADSTVTICPTVPGEVVTVTFTAFNTQASNDGLYVFNGNSITAPQISSSNPAGTVPGGLAGSYWGTVIPGPFTSSSPDGCLTFRFRSGTATNAAGWTSNVTCAPAPTCPKPYSLTASTVMSTSATLGWTNAGPATAWEVIALPCGTPAPTATTTGWIAAPTNPFVLTGLNSAACYDFYVRSVCSPTENSEIAGPVSFTTQAAPPVCGGNFVDAGGLTANYANNTDSTVTICPTVPGEVVTVTFTAFNTQASNDGLYVFNGNSIASPQISSGNPAGTVPGGLAGSYWGTVNPGSFTSSSPDGCLTFRFRSGAATNAAGWVANITCAPAPVCPAPFSLVASAATSTTVNLAWTSAGTETAWEVIALPCGAPAPTATSIGTPAPTNPFVLTGLTPDTCYILYVRAVCSATESSSWTGPKTITTQIAPPVCGGQYVDAGGISANYPNSSDSTITICPTIPGQQVTVTFTSFNTEANWDGLYVFDGNSIASPQIASANPAANVPGGLAGSYWGTAIPGPFTSSSPDGCLTFRFRSDGSVNNPGWVANVTCAPAPTCAKPILLTTTAITATSVTLGWTQPLNPDGSQASAWQVLVLPCGSPAPTATSTGWIATTTNPLVITGLASASCFDFYVRAVCSPTDSSTWAGPKSATTPVAPPVCGGNFVDVGGISANYPNNSNSTVTICPTNPGDIVTVTFTSFDTEANWDGLYVFDGNSVAAPQIASTNPAANVPGGLAGSYWGTTIPGPFTSTSVDGCLTFRFRSDGSVNRPGWVANITCTPPPTCAKPILLTATSITQTSASLSWTQPLNPDGSMATAWEILVLPAGSPAPLATTLGIATTSPYLVTGLNPGTAYKFYVRAICSPTDSSLWAMFSFATAPINDECSTAIMAPVNQNLNCVQVTPGTITGATASTQATTCLGTPNDDVWFQFVATANSHTVSFLNVTPATALNFGVYTGSNCGSLTQVNCVNGASGVLNNLIVGNTYLIRVYSTVAIPQVTNFNLCIGTVPCQEAVPFCTGQVLTYPNSVNVPNLGSLGCLGSSPNSSFFFLQVNQAGTLSYLMTQSNTAGGPATLDVDYALWGPFTDNAAACAVIPNNNPLSCSYSAAPTENFTIANAQLCQIYVVMITNFSNNPGFITFTQTNTTGGGTTACYPYNTFNYSANSYCQNATPNPTPILIAGAVSGTYTSSPSGMVIDSVTGVIDLNASAPGSYIVTSTTVPSTGGVCPTIPNIITTRSVIITAVPSATITYNTLAFCNNTNAPQLVTQTGTANGTYSASPSGLLISPNNGSFTPSASIPGTYTVTYAIPASGGCSAFSTTSQVIITALPITSFEYDATVYCQNGANPILTFTGGGVAGVFSSTPGLSLDTTTGAINVSLSTVGAYAITNTIAAANGCPDATSTFNITITASPIADFSYAQSPYCQNAGIATPTFASGGVAGVFSSTPGLSLDTVTGVVDLALSTAGTYMVTNTIVAANGCSQVTGTASITITTLPVSTFEYDSTVYCKNGANPILSYIGGGVAGIFSSTSGLALNSSTGAIDLSTSTAGNYTITNTIIASNGCPNVVSTFNITITAPPIAAFSYAQSPYCQNAGSATPTFVTGGVAGVFSSTPGLSLDTATGVINLATSTAGTYVVTNFIAAANGCGEVTEIASITITPLPISTFEYDFTSYCQNGSNPILSYTGGGVAGNFSSTAGLTLDTVTGAIDLSTSVAGSYTITNTIAASNGCPNVVSTFTITIIPEVAVEIKEECLGPIFTLTALPIAGSFDPTLATYSWTGPNGFTSAPSSSPTLQIPTAGNVAGNYVSTVIYNGCSTVNSYNVTSIICTIQKGISPNGDGDNESFLLTDVKNLSIFNRYGSKVYSHGANYTDQWHGQSDKGDELPDGTYYYVIERNTGETKTGWIYINR